MKTPTNELDLLVVASRVICPATAFDGPAVVGMRDGVISHVETTPQNAALPPARETLRFGEGCVVVPGLVDLHAHPARGGSRFGIDPDTWMLPSGSTTVMSQGDAGARNADAYIRDTIEGSRTRVKLAINFCANGESDPKGRFFSLDEANIDECVVAIKRGGTHIWGISLNIAFIQGDDVDPLEVLARGKRAADLAGVPVMFGATKTSAVPLDNQLKHLRAGDVMTYCFHQGEGSIVQGGRVLDCVWEARERGVLFDVGDGTAAFGFEVAETAIAEGFLPDTISTDFYRKHVDAGEINDMPFVISKLMAAGMTSEQCWPRITSRPSEILGIGHEVGLIKPGASADLCVLRLGSNEQELRDGSGGVRHGRVWEAVCTIKAGELVTTTPGLQR